VGLAKIRSINKILRNKTQACEKDEGEISFEKILLNLGEKQVLLQNIFRIFEKEKN